MREYFGLAVTIVCASTRYRVVMTVMLAAAGMATVQCRAGPLTDERAIYRLVVPFPITGPRAVQDPERVTRTDQAVAAHAPAVVTEVLARIAMQALAGDTDHRVVRERRSRDVVGALTDYPKQGGRQDRLLVLAGDEVVDRLRERDVAFPADRFKLIEPLATMPYVLICKARQCSNERTNVAAIFRRPIRSFASTGEGGTSHRLAEQLLRALVTRALHVPYRGGTSAWNAILKAEVDITFAALPVAFAYVSNAKIDAIGIASDARFPLLPELPTLLELGLNRVSVQGWFALFGSVTLPQASQRALAALLNAYRRQSHVHDALLMRGLTPAGASHRR